MKIGAIDIKGEINLSFNTDMIAPKTINQKVYRNVFRAKIKSNLDASEAFGRVGIPPKRLLSTRKLLSADDYNEAAKL